MEISVAGLVFVVFFLLFAVVPIVLLVLAIVDLARRPAWQWSAAEQNQIVWVLVILLIACLGPIIYFVVARPRLEAVAGGDTHTAREEPGP